MLVRYNNEDGSHGYVSNVADVRQGLSDLLLHAV
jgi:hypothetical protein